MSRCLARAYEVCGFRLIRELIVEIDDRCDIARGCFRQTPRHGLPMPLHEGERDDTLKHHDGRNDDEERAGIKALR